MGFKDGAEDVRAFRRACLEDKVTPIKSLILASAMSVARVVLDPAGNSKLAKNAGGGRRLNAPGMTRRRRQSWRLAWQRDNPPPRAPVAF